MDSQLHNDLQVTPEESGETVVALLKQAFINEKAAPEVLTYEGTLIERLTSVISNQEEVVQHLLREGSESELLCSIYSTEISRIKYLLRAYLRCRLLKIEKYVMYLLDNDEEGHKLSAGELEYAQEYFYLFGKHMRDSVLMHLPPGFRELTKQSNDSEDRDMIPIPDLTRHVFCKVLQDCGKLELDNQGVDAVDLQKDNLFAMRYELIQDKLREGYVQLM